MSTSISTLSRLQTPDYKAFGPDAMEGEFTKWLTDPNISGYALPLLERARDERMGTTKQYLEQLGGVNAMQRALAEREMANKQRKDFMDFVSAKVQHGDMSTADAFRALMGGELRDVLSTDAARLGKTRSEGFKNYGEGTDKLGQAGYFPEVGALTRALGMPVTEGLPTGALAGYTTGLGTNKVELPWQPDATGQVKKETTTGKILGGLDLGALRGRAGATPAAPAAAPVASGPKLPPNMSPAEVKSATAQADGSQVITLARPRTIGGKPVTQITVDKNGKIIAAQ
jgi:hypothetical protein